MEINEKVRKEIISLLFADELSTCGGNKEFTEEEKFNGYDFNTWFLMDNILCRAETIKEGQLLPYKKLPKAKVKAIRTPMQYHYIKNGDPIWVNSTLGYKFFILLFVALKRKEIHLPTVIHFIYMMKWKDKRTGVIYFHHPMWEGNK